MPHCKGKNLKHIQTYILLIILSIVSCSSLTVRDDKTFHKAEVSALKGNDKAWESIDEALKAPPPKNEPNLHNVIFSRLGMLQNKNAEKLLRKYLQDPNEKKREAAFTAYKRRKKFLPAKEVNTQMLQAMEGNIVRFGKWTQAEKNIFTEIDQKTQIKFLKSLKLPYDNKFYLDTLQTLLAKEVYKSKNKVITPRNGKVYEDAILQSGFFSYKQKKSSYKIFDRITVVYKENAKEHFVWLIKEFSQEKLHRQILAEYVQKKFNMKISTPETKKQPVEKPQKKYLNIKPKKSVKKKIPQKNNVLSKEQLITLARKYNLDSQVFANMERNISSHIHDKSKKAEQRYLFTVMQKIYPEKSFFELREKLEDPFQSRSFFMQLMKTIQEENPAEEMQLLILRKIGGLNYQDSSLLWKMYKEEFL